MMEALSSYGTLVLKRPTRRTITEDGILHSDCRENLKSFIALPGCTLQWRRNVSPVKYELGSYIPEDAILHSHRRENLKSYIALTGWTLQRRRNVSPVKYELGFDIHKTTFFIVRAVNSTDLTLHKECLRCKLPATKTAAPFAER
jgi:hypothetical protein